MSGIYLMQQTMGSRPMLKKGPQPDLLPSSSAAAVVGRTHIARATITEGTQPFIVLRN